MPTRRAVLAAATTLAAPLSAPDPAAAQPARWTIATEYPETAIPGEGIRAFADAVAARCGDALAVQPRFDGPDGLRSATMPAAVTDGRIQAGDSLAATLASLSPTFQLSGLPFLTRSATDTARLLDLARPAYAAALEAQGLALLYATPWPPTGLWSRRPVPDPVALRGLRVRTYDAASTAVFATAGALPFQLSFADALPRIKAGELDAAVSSGDGGAGLRLWEALPCFTELDYAYPLSLAFCGEPALAALPPAVADAVRAAGAATERRQFEAMTGRLARNQARMRDNGVSITTAPELRDYLAERAQPVIAAWTTAADPAAREALAAFRAT